MVSASNHRLKAIVLAALMPTFVAGCDSKNAVAPTNDPVLAFVGYLSGSRVDAPTPKYRLVLESGRLFEIEGQSLRESAIGSAELATLREGLRDLSTQSPANYYPPDAAHVTIGIRRSDSMVYFSWTGDERVFGPAVSIEQRQFIRAWSKARDAIERSMPGTWNSVADGAPTIQELLAQIRQ